MWTRATRLLNSDWGLYLTRGGVVGTNFFSMLVIAFLMKADEFGYYALMWASAMSLSSIVSVGVPSLLLRELSAYQINGYCGISRGHVLHLVLVWPVVLLVTVVGLAVTVPAILPVFGKLVPALGPTLLVAAAAFAINILNVIAVVYRILGHAGAAMALRDAGPQALMLVATILVAFRGRPEAQTSFAAFFILAFATVAMALVLTQQRLKEQFARLPKDHVAGRRVLIAGFWGTTVANMVWTQVDVLLGGLVLAPATLGHYQVLKRIANLAAMPQIIANWSAVVQIGRAFAAGAHDVLRLPLRPSEAAARIARGLARMSPDPLRQAEAMVNAMIRDLDLKQAEARLLRIFAASLGQIVTRDELSQQLHGEPWTYGDRRFDVHVTRIRRKLREAWGDRLELKTIRSVGYALELSD